MSEDEDSVYEYDGPPLLIVDDTDASLIGVSLQPHLHLLTYVVLLAALGLGHVSVNAPEDIITS